MVAKIEISMVTNGISMVANSNTKFMNDDLPYYSILGIVALALNIPLDVISQNRLLYLK